MRGLHRTPLSLALCAAIATACGSGEADTDVGSTMTDSDDGPLDLGICGRYASCVTATGEIVPGLQSTYGETGSCWSEFGTTVCYDTCQQQLADLREQYPAESACQECQVDDDGSWLPGTCDAGTCVAGGGVDSTSNPSITACSLSTIDPALDNPIISGDEAGMIPSAVGEALERNCGCHYTSSAPSPYVPFQGGTQLQTLANFRNPYSGANSQYVGMAAYEVVFDRVVRLRNMPMALCETDEGTPMTNADLALFTAWLDQDAPDGATFTPP